MTSKIRLDVISGRHLIVRSRYDSSRVEVERDDNGLVDAEKLIAAIRMVVHNGPIQSKIKLLQGRSVALTKANMKLLPDDDDIKDIIGDRQSAITDEIERLQATLRET